MKDNIPQRELPKATPRDVAVARQLIRDGLGEEFDVEYGLLPRNVGVMGDEGVRGDTTLITSESASPAKSFAELYEQVGQVATELCNETTTTKVLIDVTPTDVEPRFLSKAKKEETVPFVDLCKRRVEGYVHLKRKYYDRLDADPMLQTAVWSIMNVIDAKFKVRMVYREMEEKYGLK
jgi:hypothetical protein